MKASKSKKSDTPLSPSQTKELKDAFSLFKHSDGDSDEIKAKDLKMVMRALGFEPKKQDITEMLKGIDVDEGGTLSLEQFMSLMSGKLAEKDIKDEIGKAFNMFDDDNTGKISLSNLKRVANELGETISEEELKEMIQEADIDKDGEVNQDEFFRIMKKTSLY